MARNYPSYNVYQDRAGEWRWSYEARNGRTIAVSSEGYVKYEDALHGVTLMQGSSADPVYVPSDKARG